MKVILNQTVPKVGKAGTIVNVADGFARNYLFARGLAIVADKRQIEALEKRTSRVAAKTAGEKTSAEATRENLNGKTVRIEGQVGKSQGKLFGAITSQDVVDAIQKQLGVAVDKKKVALVEPIKKLGRHEVEIDLHQSVDAKVTVEVYDPAAPAEEAAPQAGKPEEPAASDDTEPAAV
jgi:large subunit ribosomal protein L9